MSTLTLSPVPTSPRQDAMDLHKAFKGYGCDSAAVIDILAHRDAMQRSLIQQEYRTMYHEELSSRISSELRGHFKNAMLLWLHDPAGRDAIIIREAFCGDTIDLPTAIEVICSRTPSQIQTIKQIYHAKFNTSLEIDIQLVASGDLQKLLLSYVRTVRYEGPEVDPGMAARDARDLYEAGERRLGTDENTFIQIFSKRSGAQLAAAAYAYHDAYGNSLEKAVKGETSGDFKFALLTILWCANNPAKYFAKMLRKAMKGLGTRDTALIRNMVTRTEIDMQYIKAEYQKKYKATLAQAIHSDTSGHYRTFLLSLVGHD